MPTNAASTQPVATARREVPPTAPPAGLRGAARYALKWAENAIGVSDDELIAQLRQTIATQQQQLEEAQRELSAWRASARTAANPVPVPPAAGVASNHGNKLGLALAVAGAIFVVAIVGGVLLPVLMH